MTLADYFRQQFEFVAWADEQCLVAAATVPADRFDEDFGFSFGSLHATLVHMMAAQDVWLGRLTVNSDPAFPPVAQYPTLKSIRQRWIEIHQAWHAFFADKTDADFEAAAHFTRFGKPVHSTLQSLVGHVLDHATHHRGQLNSLVTLAGGTPGNYGRMIWTKVLGETVME